MNIESHDEQFVGSISQRALRKLARDKDKKTKDNKDKGVVTEEQWRWSKSVNLKNQQSEVVNLESPPIHKMVEEAIIFEVGTSIIKQTGIIIVSLPKFNAKKTKDHDTHVIEFEFVCQANGIIS